MSKIQSFLDSTKIRHWPFEKHTRVTHDVETDYPTTTQVSDTVKPKETLGAEGILGAAKNRPECDQGGDDKGDKSTLTDQDLLAMSELDAALSDLPTESMDRYAALHGRCCWNVLMGFSNLCLCDQTRIPTDRGEKRSACQRSEATEGRGTSST